MNILNVTFAQYIYDPDMEVNTSIRATIDGQELFVPLDPANRHYAEILKQVEAGTLVVQPADEN
jgi:hypothetical protein